MSDELYDLMRSSLKRIKKLSAPIEMIYDLEEDSEASGVLYSDVGGASDEYSQTAEELVEYAAGIGESIFVFLLDLGVDKSGYAKKFREHFSNHENKSSDAFVNEDIEINEDTGLPEFESKSYTFLDNFPKLKKIVSEKLSNLGKGFSDSIVIFLNKGEILGNDTRDPVFFIHDIYHSYEITHYNVPPINILETLFKFYGNHYFDISSGKSIGWYFKTSGRFGTLSNVPEQILNFDISGISNDDWHNHLFAYSLIKGSGNIIPLSEITTRCVAYYNSSDKTFRFSPSVDASSPEELVVRLEKEIYSLSQAVISQMKGSVIFNII